MTPVSLPTPPLSAQRPPALPLNIAGGAGAPARGALFLAGEHFAAATLFLLAGAIGLVWIAPDLARGDYLSPHVAGITHLFTLGWLTLTIFGALSQLLPVALGAPIRSERVGHIAFWMLAPGIAMFACGVADSSSVLVGIGVTLVALGILLEVGNIGATLVRGHTHDVTWSAIAISITFLTSTLVFGLILADNLHTGFVAAERVRILTAHLHVAIVGWALIVMVGVSNRLLPMFLLVHGADTRWSRRALILFALGVPTLATGLVANWIPATWTGVVLLDTGLGAFVWQAYTFYRVRVRRNLDIAMRFVRTSVPFFAVSGVTGPVLLALGVTHTRLATAYIVSGLLGGIVLFVTGLLYKIVPLLAWTARYGGQIGRGPVPMAADLYSARVARAQLVLTVSGVALLLAGIAATSPLIARVGTSLFLCGIVLFAFQFVRIRWGTPAAFRSPAKSR